MLPNLAFGYFPHCKKLRHGRRMSKLGRALLDDGNDFFFGHELAP
jgi:hypothetical protein